MAKVITQNCISTGGIRDINPMNLVTGRSELCSDGDRCFMAYEEDVRICRKTLNKVLNSTTSFKAIEDVGLTFLDGVHL